MTKSTIKISLKAVLSLQSAIDIAKQHPDAKREEFMRLFDQHKGRRTRIAQVQRHLLCVNVVILVISLQAVKEKQSPVHVTETTASRF